MMNKYTHFDVLLLTLYYNLDGPFGYYPLITQSGPGEGDKDTFAMAAHFYNRPYHQLSRPPHYGGFGNQFYQGEPIWEFEKLQNVLKDIKVKLDEGEEYNFNKMFNERLNEEDRKLLFYHMHDPKWNPFRFMREKQTLNDNDEDIRVLGRTERVSDLELVCYSIMYHDFCEMGYQFTCFEDESQEDKDKICGFLQHRLEWLNENTWDNEYKGFNYTRFVDELDWSSSE
ncbi:unnamed protein product [Ambrosiozyma monospora]|uniref:Unnamed protein product n=1 Tax=Ambrosiozyma monospora TaxID=43982 RepID=A0ACB5U9R3_AMBMO|nr:unnamed protein product [Ambrosiozyma monospora]